MTKGHNVKHCSKQEKKTLGGKDEGGQEERKEREVAIYLVVLK